MDCFPKQIIIKQILRKLLKDIGYQFMFYILKNSIGCFGNIINDD